MTDAVHIVGGGLAGSEAAWQLAEAGVPVVLHEMRGVEPTPAHHTADFAELVCSNSFRSDEAEKSAIGLLHEEMRRLGSLILASRPEEHTSELQSLMRISYAVLCLKTKNILGMHIPSSAGNQTHSHD